MGFGNPIAHSGSGIFGTKGFFGTFVGEPGSVLSHIAEEGQALIPSITTGPPFHFPESSLVYFQFVFAAITPILALGSVLGRVNFKAWIPFVALWITFVYAVDAFLLWGGGYFAAHGALDYSGGYVIHLSAGVSGFVFAAVIGPRLQRDREIDAPEQPADGRGAAPACCGSAGTGSTAGTPTTPARTPRRRCSTRTCAPRSRCWSGSRGTTSTATSRR